MLHHFAAILVTPWNLRRYKGDAGMIGLEPTFEEHVENLVAVFREVRRVLRDDGTFWLNYGDSYANDPKWGGYTGGKHVSALHGATDIGRRKVSAGLKPKDLMEMPSAVAAALREDGWWLRSRIPWLKENPMPESVYDRPTSAVEYVFFMAKSGNPLFWTHTTGYGVRSRPPPDYYWRHRHTREIVDRPPYRWEELRDDHGLRIWSRLNHWTGHDYFYDHVAVRTTQMPDSVRRLARARNSTAHVGPGMAQHAGIVGYRTDKKRGHLRRHVGFNERWDSMSKAEQQELGANMRNYIVTPTEPVSVKHFATFPKRLITPFIMAATSEKGCCRECGAPYARHTETKLVPTAKAAKRCVVDERDHIADPRSAGSNRQKDGHTPGWANSVRTKGWFPTCECDIIDPVPCTVLDPFAGSGTVALVANEMGRDAILCEISPEYADMARRRIAEGLGWFAKERA